MLFRGGVDYPEIHDEVRSEEEGRFIAAGPVKRGVIVVAHTGRSEEDPPLATQRRIFFGS